MVDRVVDRYGTLAVRYLSLCSGSFCEHPSYVEEVVDVHGR